MPAAKEASLESVLEPGRRVAILAGAGDLPRKLARRLLELGHEPYIIAFKRQTDPRLVEGYAHGWFRLGATARIMEALRAEGISDLVMIGAIRRPSLRELKPDWKAAEFFMNYGLKIMGDDGLLQALRQFLGKEGFRIHGIHRFMPELIAPAGVMGRIKPSEQDARDIAQGRLILSTIAPLDIGQAVVVQQGFVLGVEAAEGTDELLRRCAGLRREGGGGVLIKLAKTQQDRDLDMPTIGPDTIENVFDAGLAGLAVQAGATLITDYERVIAIAEAHKIFIIGVDGSV